MNMTLIRLLGCKDGNDPSQWVDPDDPDWITDPEASGWIRDSANPNMWYNPDDPYGIESALESGMSLSQWQANSEQIIEETVNSEYQDRIDQETDPDRIAELEKARDDKIDSMKSELDDICKAYEQLYVREDEIKAKYGALIAAVPIPDPNDPDAVAQYLNKISELEAQRDAELDALYAQNDYPFNGSSPFDSLSVGSTVIAANLAPALSWEDQMNNMIKTDKDMIKLLNETIPAINLSMQTSMRTVAEFVLVQMLRDPRLPDDQAMKKYQAYIYIPQGLDPYASTSGSSILNDQQAIGSVSGGSPAANIFAPVYNTEPSERLFLQFGSSDEPGRNLHQFFPVADSNLNNSGHDACGLDQWFIRTGEAVNEKGVRPRTEGALGLQRGYKDANLNETGEGAVVLSPHAVDRGNHVVNLYLAGAGLTGFLESDDSPQSTSSVNQGNSLFRFLMTALSSFLGNILNELADVKASCGNKYGDGSFIPMCTASNEIYSLKAEYEWSSSKWLCIGKGKPSLFTYCLIFNKFDEVNCDLGYSRSRFMGKFKQKGKGHYHIPKWFCGFRPRYLGDVGLDPKGWIIQMSCMDMLPPIAGAIEGAKHGYMTHTLDVDHFLEPFRQLGTSDVSKKREDYESCVCFIDGLLTNRLNIDTGGASGIINGHARIYGDDKDVWDPETYVGEVVKPWILSEKFFSGAGTIVIGAAMKHENPFVQMLGMLQMDENIIDGKSVLSAFDPPSYSGLRVGVNRVSAGNYMWTMSAARAGVRRVRRGGTFDRKRMYQVVYDPTSDPENLHFANQPYRYKLDSQSQPGNSLNQSNNPWEPYGNSGDSTHDPRCVLAGCVCHQTNEKQFQYVWNLCELDWDATLLPIRYAGCEAKLAGFGDNESYQERMNNIESIVNVSDVEDSHHIRNFCGNGNNWAWTPASDSGTNAGNVNPMNPDNPNNTGWNPLDPSSEDDVKLDSLLPDGIHKVDLQNLMKRRRIL